MGNRIKPTTVNEIPMGVDYVTYVSLLTEICFPMPGKTSHADAIERNFPYPIS